MPHPCAPSGRRAFTPLNPRLTLKITAIFTYSAYSFHGYPTAALPVAAVNTVNDFAPHRHLLERLAAEPIVQGPAVPAAVALPPCRSENLPSSYHLSPVYETLRRGADIVLSAAVTVFLLPLLVSVAALVWLQDGGPPVFAQQRIGRGGRLFRCFKFRSMVQNAGERLERLLAEDPQARVEWALHHKLRKDPRITALGQFLRKSSLDEIPQVFNVLSGVMSLVGPRPIVPDEMERYGWRIRHYASVPPGITGLWQISGRSDVTYRRRVAMDCVYVRRRGPALDVKILLGTVPSVLFSRGAR